VLRAGARTKQRKEQQHNVTSWGKVRHAALPKQSAHGSEGLMDGQDKTPVNSTMPPRMIRAIA